jgi:hypothetical protein
MCRHGTATGTKTCSTSRSIGLIAEHRSFGLSGKRRTYSLGSERARKSKARTDNGGFQSLCHIPTPRLESGISFAFSQSTEYGRRWTERGLPGYLLPVDGADHFTILDALARPEGALTGALPPSHGRRPSGSVQPTMTNSSRYRQFWLFASAPDSA